MVRVNLKVPALGVVLRKVRARVFPHIPEGVPPALNVLRPLRNAAIRQTALIEELLHWSGCGLGKAGACSPP
jgi:hypothetical protein